MYENRWWMSITDRKIKAVVDVHNTVVQDYMSLGMDKITASKKVCDEILEGKYDFLINKYV